jgi:hypothetical protein
MFPIIKSPKFLAKSCGSLVSNRQQRVSASVTGAVVQEFSGVSDDGGVDTSAQTTEVNRKYRSVVTGIKRVLLASKSATLRFM